MFVYLTNMEKIEDDIDILDGAEVVEPNIDGILKLIKTHPEPDWDVAKWDTLDICSYMMKHNFPSKWYTEVWKVKLVGKQLISMYYQDER